MPSATGVAVVVFLLRLDRPVIVVHLIGAAASAVVQQLVVEGALIGAATGAEVAVVAQVATVTDVRQRTALHETAIVGPDRITVGQLQAEQAVEVAPTAAAADLQALIVATATLAGAALEIDVDAIDLLLENDVDHPGNRVRTVDRRGAAAENFDAFDDCRRNVRQVGEVDFAVVRRRVIGDAPAVDQHQRVIGAEAPQVDRAGRRLPGVAVVLALGHAGVLRLRCQGVVDVLVAARFHFFMGDNVDRGRAITLRTGDSRAGDGDFFHAVIGAGRRGHDTDFGRHRCARRAFTHAQALGTLLDLQAAAEQGLLDGLTPAQRSAHGTAAFALHQILAEGNRYAGLA